MRIALVNVSLDPARGSDLVTLEMAKRLASAHTVTLVSMRATNCSAEGVTILAPSSQGTRPFLKFWRALRRELRDCDVVHSHHAVVSLILPAQRLVTTYHGFRGRLNLKLGPRIGEGISQLIRRWLIRPALMRSRAVVLVSNSLAPETTTVAEDAIHVIYNGVDEPVASLRNAKPTHFLYVGRLDPDKNLGELLSAYRAGGSLPPLLIAGDGSMRRELEHEFASEDIRFLGRVDRDALQTLYANAFAFVSASTFETVCLPVIEAAHQGCPSIGYRSGSLPEVIQDRETGWLLDNFERDSGEAFRAAVELDEEARAELAARCRAWAQRFSWDTAMRQYLDLYRRIA